MRFSPLTPGLLSEWAEEEATLARLADKHGQVLRTEENIRLEIGLALADRIQPRRGDQLYQVISHSLTGITRVLLEKIFPASSVTSETAGCKTWTLTCGDLIASTLAPLLTMQSSSVCAGSTKAFRTQSQRVIRVVGTLLPDFEISHYLTGDGLDRVHLGCMYVIATEHGELHWPKDSKRREIAFDQTTEANVRERILSDMMRLSERGEPLAPGFWRQLGQHEKAVAVEAELAAPRPRVIKNPRVKEVRVREPRVKKVKRCRFTKEEYEIDKVLAERKVSSKEKVVFLVRWSGYDPSWEGARISGEVGGPIETWEPLLLLAGTEALKEWRESRPG